MVTLCYQVLFKYRKLVFFVKTTKMMVKFFLFCSKVSFFVACLKKNMQTQENLPNLFSKVATASGLLDPKIDL